MTWWRRAPTVEPPPPDFLYQMVAAADQVVRSSHELLGVVDEARKVLDEIEDCRGRRVEEDSNGGG